MVYNLTKILYESNAEYPLRVYIYDSNGYHSGSNWVQSTAELDRWLKGEVAKAIAEKREVMITDGGDFAVFHSVNGEILYPKAVSR